MPVSLDRKLAAVSFPIGRLLATYLKLRTFILVTPRPDPVSRQWGQKEWHAAIGRVSGISNEAGRERAVTEGCASGEPAVWERGGAERFDATEGEGEGGRGDGREGCSAAVERSERRLRSLPMGGIRLCYHSTEAPRLAHLHYYWVGRRSEGAAHI